MSKFRVMTVGLIVAALLVAGLVSSAVASGVKVQSSGGTIKVGSILPATNSSGGISLPQTAETVKASVKAFNKRGGLDGQKLELHLCDTQGDVNKEADCARQMVSDGVVATLDDFTFNNPETTAKILGDAGIARVGINFTSLAEWQSPVSFALNAGPVANFSLIGDSLIKAGNTKLAEVIIQTPTAPTVKALLQPGIKASGGDIVTEVFIPAGTTDYSQYVAAATKDGATAALLLVDYPDASAFMTAMQQLNSDLVVGVSASTFTLDNFKKFSAISKKGVIADPFPNVTSSGKSFPALKQFRADMKGAGFKLPELKGQALAAWASVFAFVTVMKGATGLTPASVLATFKSATAVDMQGLIPPWTPNAESTSALFVRVSNPYGYSQKFTGANVKTLLPAVDVMALVNPPK